MLPVFVLLFHWPWVCAELVSFQAEAGTRGLHLWLTALMSLEQPGRHRAHGGIVSVPTPAHLSAEVAAAQATSAQSSGGCSTCSEVCRTCGEPQHHKAWVLFDVFVVLGNPWSVPLSDSLQVLQGGRQCQDG